MKKKKYNKLKDYVLKAIVGGNEFDSFTIPSEEAIKNINQIWWDTYRKALNTTDTLERESLLKEATRINEWLKEVYKAKLRLKKAGWEILDQNNFQK